MVSSNVTSQLNTNAKGKFDSSTVAGINFQSGIILSTGLVGSYLNTISTYHSSTDIGMTGDSDLDSLVTIPGITEDASVLEFDFIAASDSVTFSFIFASEEYNEYVNVTLRDIFALFISGPGYLPNTNLALVPGTSDRININTINNGQSSGTSSGPCMNCSYFVDNVGTNAVGLSYDGYTTEITIGFVVLPCTEYHFKIAISDVSDGIDDSALIIREAGMNANSYLNVFNNGAQIDDTLYLCNGGNVTLTADTALLNYNWNTGETTQSIIVTQPGLFQYYTFSAGGCFSFSNVITVLQSPSGNIQTPVIIQNNTLLEAPNITPTPNMTWQWFLNGFPIPGATQSTYTFAVNGCYRLTIYEDSCESTSNEICVTNTSLYEIKENSIIIYPNPVTNVSVIETPFADGSVTTLKLLDISGREVMTLKETKQTQIELEKGSLRSGIYFLEISNSDYKGSIIRKIVIQ